MAAQTDNLIAYRFMHLLITPIKEWDAYKKGYINDNGELLKNVSDDTFNDFHLLALRIKLMILKTPGFSKYLTSWNASKELLNKNTVSPVQLSTWNVSNKAFLGNMNHNLAFMQNEETAAGTSVGGGNVAGITGEPPVSKNAQKKYLKLGGVMFRRKECCDDSKCACNTK